MRPKQPRTALAGLLAATAATLGAPAAAACATGHITVSLSAFPPEAVSRSFYYAAEPDMGSTGAPFTVRTFGDDCSFPSIGVDYATSGGSAQAGADYQPTSGRVELILPIHDQATQQVAVPVNSDADVESVVESTDILLSNPSGARLIDPFTAPLFIIDVDGSTRVAFDGALYSQSESSPSVRIPVFRGGAATGPSTVSYSISAAGTAPATPGADFAAASPGTINFGPGERVKTIDFSLVNDDAAEPPETLTISLSGAEVVAPNMTTFTILDNEEGIAPSSKFHHPRHRWRYPYNDYRLREMHVFTTDEQGGSGVVQVEVALRRRSMSGKCAWWNGKRFRGGDCSEKVWHRMKAYEPGFFYYYRIKALGPSVNTHVRNYTAYARATDGAGNVENVLQVRRNRNTFEVKQRTS
jgi:Calx-beta domain-containing protein